jgi:oligopeptidase A
MAGSFLRRQVNFADLDMTLHSQKDVDPLEIQRQMASKYAAVKPIPEDKMICSFTHIFAGGYAAGYYSYLWAETMAADSFDVLQQPYMDPRLSSEEKKARLADAGRQFEDTFLGLGGAVHPSEVFRRLRGRESPDVNFLLQSYGLGK